MRRIVIGLWYWEKIAWKTWLSFRDVDTVFQEYSNLTAIVIPDDSPDFSLLQRFVVLMYHTTSAAENVNQARRILFTQKNRNIKNVPPTADALLQHLKRAIYQCNIWKNCLTAKPAEHDPCKWG